MPTRAAIALLLVLGVVLTLGVSELFRLRFSGGDVYPYGSSLRADPLGTKALHDALRELPGLTVERNVRPLDELAVDRATVVFLLGVSPRDLPGAPLLLDAEALSARGARVILAFEPLAQVPRVESSDETSDKIEKPARPGKPSVAQPARLEARWLELPEGADGLPAVSSAELEPGANVVGLPERLPLHTALAFSADTLGPRARVLYRRNGQPVVSERPLGSGALVLVADGFLFANEGLLRERQPALLAWALGDARRVVFDESHLGVEEQSGVMVLARRYRLLPVLAVLALLAALFVWRSASSLVPPVVSPANDSALVAGGNAASGLAKLLARGIPPREILKLCAERWTHDCGRGQDDAARAVAELARQAADPVTGYREIRGALARLSPRRGDHAH